MILPSILGPQMTPENNQKSILKWSKNQSKIKADFGSRWAPPVDPKTDPKTPSKINGNLLPLQGPRGATQNSKILAKPEENHAI